MLRCWQTDRLALGMDDRPVTPGVIVMDKPEGAGSAGMCRLVKGRLCTGGAPKKVKVGHGGTLDPLATGVVVVLVGKATKMSDAVMAGDKRYLAGVDLSAFTPSFDRETEREPVDVPVPPTIERVREAVGEFVGDIAQVPPAYSALWIDGQRAYHLVRAGKAPEMTARPAVVHSIEVLAYHWPIVTLGTGGTLMWLRRTQVGRWTIRDAISPESLPRELNPWASHGAPGNVLRAVPDDAREGSLAGSSGPAG